MLVTGVSSGLGIKGFSSLALCSAGARVGDGVSWQQQELQAMSQPCSGQGSLSLASPGTDLSCWGGCSCFDLACWGDHWSCFSRRL